MGKYRVLTTSAACLVAAATLSACGSSDSTVSGTPSSPAAPPPPSQSGRSSTSAAPKPGGGGFPESPQTVPSSAPGLDSPQVDARESAYLDSLRKEGITTDKLELELIAAGNGICRIRATGGAAAETTTLANAMAGQLVAGGFAKGQPDEVSQKLIDVSIAELCP